MIRHIAEHEFDMYVINSDKNIVIVDFWAPWCKPCQAMHPVLDAVSRRFTLQMDIIKINIDDEQRLAKISGIRSIPALVYFQKGKVVGTDVGVKTEEYMTGKITDILKASAIRV